MTVSTMPPGLSPERLWPDRPTVVSADTTRVWMALAGLSVAALTFPALKVPVGFDLRIGQIALLGTFAVLMLRDLQSREVRWGPLLLLVSVGVALSIISSVSSYPKLGQATFMIKLVVVFPTAFYVGLRLYELLGPRRLVRLFEVGMAGIALVSIGLDLVPVPLLIHERPPHLSIGMKGPFWEQIEMAFVLGIFMMAALALRIEGNIRPRRPWLLVIAYTLVLGCLVASRNKTIWLSLLAAMFAAGFLYRGSAGGGDMARRWAVRLCVAGVFGAVALFAYNYWLPPADRLVTVAMLENKWEVERGAALRLAWDLIGDAPWLGHGLGFVAAYFGTVPSDIVGLGGGAAQLFNVYLDTMLSLGLPGLVYLLVLLAAAFTRRHLLSVMVVVYLFIFGQLNPVSQYEYYHLFLGMAYALVRETRRAAPTTKEVT